MKKSLFGIAAVAAIIGMVVIGTNLEAAGPVMVKKSALIKAEGFDSLSRATSTSAAAATALNYTTGFEVVEGFTARDGTCSQNPCSGGVPNSGGAGYTGECGFIDGQGLGGYPAPWGVSGSNAGNIEGHVDTAHPYAGAQHLRVSYDNCDAQNPFGFATDARIPPGSPLPGVIGPATYKGQIAISGLFGSNVFWQPQSSSQGYLTTRTLFYFYGWFYILDDYGAGLTYVPVFTNWDDTGNYQEISVHHDPCAKHICIDNGYGTPLGVGPGGLCPNGNSDCRVCVGGTDDGAPCIGDFQCGGGGVCTGGDCVGRVDYSYGGAPLYTGSLYAGTTSEQFLIYTDNFPGDNDVDDLVVETGDPCPTICGNLEIEPGEECDGINDGFCPGACVAPGGTGPNGEGECTCVVGGPTCDSATPAVNGSNSEYSHGGWWTFTADTTAYAVETCGTATHDTAIFALTGVCDSLEVLEFNDDCDDNTYGYGLGADPLASCYAIGGIDSPYNSCLCIATNPGQQYWVLAANAGLGRETIVTLTKRNTCGEVWENGACCDGYGTCVDDVAAGACADLGDVWTAQKYCSTVEPCDVTLGACCDRSPLLGGACTDGVEAASCAGPNQVYSLGALCADVTCTEVTGACCNGVAGTCSQTLKGNCNVSNSGSSWTQETSCSAITCTAVPGACCDHFNPDPLALDGICTSGVISADCQGENLEWTKGVSCSAVQCDAVFQAIPTVSEWGLVVLALLLLVGAKVYFGRRQAATA
jgi:hypothetical protein